MKNVRQNLGSRIFEAGAEKALQKNSKLVSDFFVSETYEFEVTDPDDKHNTIITSKTGVICNDVPKLKEMVDQKRGFQSKIKLEADGGGGTMKVCVNFQKSHLCKY